MSKAWRILLGVTGSIAAYKTPLLVRAWVKAGHEVRVVLTDAAADFVSPLSLATVAKGPVYRRYYDPETGEWTNHVALAEWADVLVVAPVSVQTLAKLAYGFSDNLLTTTYLSFDGPVFLAPAMDREMFRHEATQASLQRVSARAQHMLIEPGEGELASGQMGKGRMAEPEHIAETVLQHLNRPAGPPPVGRHWLVTAGPTYEPLDPVRFIGNRSSGKMGFALAEALAAQGAEVSLLAGPVRLPTPPGVAERVDVETAEEMYHAAHRLFPRCDGLIMAAAVADYRPAAVSAQKLKKQAEEEQLQWTMTRNPDILKSLAALKRSGQFVVGFSLETHDALKHARRKRQEKGCDMMVLNTLEDEGAGFEHNTNKVHLLTATQEQSLPLLDKRQTARRIVEFIAQTIKAPVHASDATPSPTHSAHAR
jgi:phosphopantothenoylcysteine decarboxylase/phosphopantothenate--cysteine ligase